MFIRFLHRKDLLKMDNFFSNYGNYINVNLKDVHYQNTDNLNANTFKILRGAIGILNAQKTYFQNKTIDVFVNDVLFMMTENSSTFYMLKFVMDYDLKYNANKFDLVLDAITKFDILATVDKEVIENLVLSATKKDVAMIIKLCNNLKDKLATKDAFTTQTNVDVDVDVDVDDDKIDSCNDVVSVLKLNLYYELYNLTRARCADSQVYDLVRTYEDYSKKFDSNLLKNACFNDLIKLKSTIDEISMICWSVNWDELSNQDQITTVNKCLENLILFKMTIQ